MSDKQFRVENGLYVSGTANVAGTLRVDGDLAVTGQFLTSITSNGDIIPVTASTLNLGNTTFRWGLFSTSINANGTITGTQNLSITGTSTLGANVAVDTNVLFVDTVNNRVGVNKVPTVAFDVSGAGAFSSTLGVTGVTTLSANLAVDTNVLFVDGVNNRVGVNKIPASNFDVSGAGAFSGDLDVTGNTSSANFLGNLNWSFIQSKPDPVVTVTLTGGVTGSSSATLSDLQSNTITIAATTNTTPLDTRYVLQSGGAYANAYTLSNTSNRFTGSYIFQDTRAVVDDPIDKYNRGINLDFKQANTVGNPPVTAGATYAHIISVMGYADQTGGFPVQISTGDGLAIRHAQSNTVWGPWRKFWHDGNDGASSGLDADTVDGLSPGNGSGAIAINNGTLNVNLNADLLDGQTGSYYNDLTNATGTLASARFSGTYSNALTFSNNSNSFTGSGVGLTALNASNLSTGTLPTGRLVGTYSSALTFSNNSNDFTGIFNAVASTTSTASLKVPHGSAPTTPENGDIWTTTAGLFSRINGATKTVAFTDGNVATATTLQTARNISLGGDASGSASFNGSTDITITATVTNSSTADTLTTARTIGISGGVTGTATSFNGSANITIPITAMDASSLSTGTIPVARVGSSTAYGVGEGSTVGGIEIGFRVVPRISTGGGTADTSARGKCYSATGGVTVPASTFAAGDAFSIFNNSASSITITQGSGLTMYGTAAATGNRTLAARGICTIWFESATVCKITGEVT